MPEIKHIIDKPRYKLRYYGDFPNGKWGVPYPMITSQQVSCGALITSGVTLIAYLPLDKLPPQKWY
jgi:hypothetical protein